MSIAKIYVIGAQHGNELFGLKILAHLQALDHPSIKLRIGNLEAIAKKRRYIESDLNRSFGEGPNTSLEHTLAAHIQSEIEAYQPDLILDLHTSRGKVGVVGIAASISPHLNHLAARLGMTRLVTMPESIASNSLIGQYPETSLSLEFGTGQRSDALALKTARAIVGLLESPQQNRSTKIPHYIVKRMIGNHEAPGDQLENYTYNQTLDGYPFLVGKNTYSEFRGFLTHMQITETNKV